MSESRNNQSAKTHAPDDHLAHLLLPETAIPWYVSLFGSIRDLIHSRQLAPLDVASRPVAVKDIWGLYESDPRSRYYSTLVHVAVFAVLWFGFTNPSVPKVIRDTVLIAPHLNPWVPSLSAKAKALQGGGGGGAMEQLPVTQGKAPKSAPKQFVPPQIADHTPKLAMATTILAPDDSPIPQSNLNNWGDPLAKMINGSNGPGTGGGMGGGHRGGLGPGDGPGYGPGSDGGVGGQVYTLGGGASAPVVRFKVDPEYSEEARKAKYSGSVLLSVVVDAEGRVRDVTVLKSLGMGLDEKAVEAVRKWKFKPGMKGGTPVNVRAQIDVNFRLL